MSLIFDWSSLASSVSSLGTGGVLRTLPQDFRVDEIPAYEASGEGDFLYLLVEKTDHTTSHVVREMCNQLGIKDRDVGVAGLKDRHAITTQWLSLPAKLESRLEKFELQGVKILRTVRHSNKLGIGHLSGNRFSVIVRQAEGQAAQAGAVMQELCAKGIPNYYGPQRFGLGGLNAEEGLRVLRGESRLRDPRLRRFLTSSVQSAIFNRYVSTRLEKGIFWEVLCGDMAKKHDTGGVFMVEDAEQESKRVVLGEISATGTLFGRKVKPLAMAAGELEREVLESFGLSADVFASRKGDRRFTRIFPTEGRVWHEPDGFGISFVLPKGSFATSLLREVMKVDIDCADIASDLETEES